MANILRAPNRLSSAERKSRVTVYLAGPFEAGPRCWRDEVIEALDDLDLTIIDPRNERWAQLPEGSPGRRGAYEWQCSIALDSDVVVVWVPEGRNAPTALMILGALGARRNNPSKGSSVVVGGNGWSGLVQLFAQNQRLFPVGPDLSEVIRVARIQAQAALGVRPC